MKSLNVKLSKHAIKDCLPLRFGLVLENPSARVVNVEIDEANRPQAVISWIAAGATNYRVEFKDALSDPNWTYLKSVQNNANDRQEISVSDSLTGDNQGRFYRVTYQP